MESEIQQDQSGAASFSDIEALYGLALGRTADKAAIDQFLGEELAFLLSVFFEGPEFRDRVLAPLSERRPPDSGFYAGDVPEDVRRWARTRLPISGETAQILETKDYWPTFYFALFTDPVFQQVVGLGPMRPFSPEAWAGLNYLVENASLFRRHAQIENVAWDWIEGWALDRDQPDLSLRLELWVDNLFVSAGEANLFRRDLQDRFGGEGAVGFRLPVGDRLATGAHLVEIRDADTGRCLTAGEQAAPPPNPEAYEALALELRGLREALDRIQSALPQAVTRLSYPLQDYARYADTYGQTTGFGVSTADPNPRILIRLWAGGVEAFEVEDAVMAILAQTYEDWRLEVNGLDDHGLRHLQSLCNRLAWTGRCVERIGVCDPDASVEEAAFDLCLNVPATGVLAPEALVVFVGAFADRDVVAVYPDADHFESIGEATTARRHSPLLRPAFDLDLLCQTPYVGPCVAFRMEAAPDAGEREAVAAAVLRLALADRRIGHVSSVLFSERQVAVVDAEVWSEQVGAALAGDEGVSVARSDDLFGANVAGAVRVRRRPRAKTVS